MEGIDFIFHLLHIHEVGENIILARINVQVLYLPLLELVVDEQLWIHDLKCHHEKNQATHDLPPGAIICIDELYIIGMEGVVACTRYMVLQNETKFPTELLETNLVSIRKAKVTGLVRINGVDLHVGGSGEVGNFVAHKPPGEGTDLIKTQLVVGREDHYVLLHVHIPVVYPNYSLWSGVDFSRSGRHDVHDVV